jgi:hypothetical protein
MHEKGDWVAGYKWVIEQLRTDHEAVSNKVHGVHLKTHTPPCVTYCSILTDARHSFLSPDGCPRPPPLLGGQQQLEIDFSMAFMKKRRFDDAIEVLKGFERKDLQMRAMAATNLAFIYFLEGDYSLAEKQADIAIKVRARVP